ncbi:unnamed protein product, partial [Prorocentrum cordatum]
GFGSVRLVEHAKTGQRYALKRVPKRRGKKVEELVVRECDLLAEMDHPFILKLVKNFDTASSIYILTELLTGGELFAALERLKRVLTREEAQFYAGSLVLVLDYLGDRRIVFRDLKPENVMLDGQGYIKLIDFGTAKKLAKDEGRTFTKIGSCQFMAPEVPLGRGYGTEVDIWSLGIMLFEFVCGYLPFGRELDNSSEVEIYRSAQEDNLTFPQFYKDSDGKHLMRGLLRKDPKSRLGTGLDGFQVSSGVLRLGSASSFVPPTRPHLVLADVLCSMSPSLCPCHALRCWVLPSHWRFLPPPHVVYPPHTHELYPASCVEPSHRASAAAQQE